MESSIKSPSITSAGIVVERPFLRVVFQNGFANEVGMNGVRVKDVIHVAMDRLLDYQSGPLACEENAEAIHALRSAIRWLEIREARRREQGVLNTMTPHMTTRTEDAIEDFSATGA